MSYMHGVTCRINCLSFAENMRQLHQYYVSSSIYLDLEKDSILISTDSANQCKKNQAECPPHSQRLASVSELMAGVKVDTHEEIMTQPIISVIM